MFMRIAPLLPALPPARRITPVFALAALLAVQCRALSADSAVSRPIAVDAYCTPATAGLKSCKMPFFIQPYQAYLAPYTAAQLRDNAQLQRYPLQRNLYVISREAFGERIADFQNTRFHLADMATTVDVMWAYVDRAMELYAEQKLTAEEAAKVKFWATDREAELLDIGVQLHGGYGYITEYPIARAYLDARVHRIYGGTNEIMRDLVARQIVGKR